MDFFNDLSKKFSHAARTVQERTRDSVESTRLSMDLRAVNSELEKNYTALGRAYYESLTVEGAIVPEELIHRVHNCLVQIENLTALRDRARQQSRCPSCGSVQPEGSRFCAHCGRPMPEAAPEMQEAPAYDDAQFCESCGAMREGAARFCAVCGHAFEAEDQQPALPVSAAEQPAAESAPAAPFDEPLEEPEDTNSAE